MVSAEVDVSGLIKALELAAQHSSRSAAEVINGAARDIIFQSAAQTKKADKNRITQDLTRAVFTVTTSKTGRLLKKPKAVYQAAELVYKIVNAKRRLKGEKGIAGQEMSQESQKLIKRRLASVGYIAYAGWNKALIAFGGRGFGSSKTGKINDQSKAARGYGKPARPEILMAEFVNRATKAWEIGGAVTQRVVNEKERDIVNHVEQKLRARFQTL
jgi:hypothetical protein